MSWFESMQNARCKRITGIHI